MLTFLPSWSFYSRSQNSFFFSSNLMHSAGYLYIVVWFLTAVVTGSDVIDTSASSLDTLLEQYAFRELKRAKTGIPYDGNVPSNLTGIKISGLKLTRYSLRWKGYGYFKEFFIPSGVIVEPYVTKLVLVYQNLANWSSFYYPLPGYTYLTPILGILPYDASENEPELDILALEEPMAIRFPYVQPAPEGSFPKCVYFYLNNWVEFGGVADGNVCLTRTQGHFSIVAEVKVAPTPSPTANDEIAPTPAPSPNEDNHHNSKMWTILVGLLLFYIFVMLFVAKKFGLLATRQRLDDSAQLVEPFIANTEDPLPNEAPTRPLLENDYVLDVKQKLR